MEFLLIKVLNFYSGYALVLAFMLQSSWVLALGFIAAVGATVLRQNRLEQLAQSMRQCCLRFPTCGKAKYCRLKLVNKT
ncbi:hypothetical protein [Neptunomonas sp.]|uniref:hypothetical protein n=1 Tax=Neptunomonas sp. TaxID=1971898 RepID=UPI0025FA264C|nr:hypothetical protein [Neptunomonas sp.]